MFLFLQQKVFLSLEANFPVRVSISIWSLVLLANIQSFPFSIIPRGETINYLEIFGLCNYILMITNFFELMVAQWLQVLLLLFFKSIFLFLSLSYSFFLFFLFCFFKPFPFLSTGSWSPKCKKSIGLHSKMDPPSIVVLLNGILILHYISKTELGLILWSVLGFLLLLQS